MGEMSIEFQRPSILGMMKPIEPQPQYLAMLKCRPGLPLAHVALTSMVGGVA